MAKQQNNEEEVLLETLGKAEHFLEIHKQKLLIGIGAIIAIVAGIIYLNNHLLPEREDKAQRDLYLAQIYFQKDSFELALKGNNKVKGFLKIADGGADYMFTKAKNLATYQAGICYLQMNKFDQAIEYLNKFSSDEDMVQAQAYSALGDCYAEKKDMGKACDYYKKAANTTKNEILAPGHLLKAGNAFEYNKDNSAALEMYNKLKKEYPNSEEGREIDKYILRAGGEI